MGVRTRDAIDGMERTPAVGTGRSEEDAKRIAAATVNKERRERGETKEQKGEK